MVDPVVPGNYPDTIMKKQNWETTRRCYFPMLAMLQHL
jgi:hypothetical protein